MLLTKPMSDFQKQILSRGAFSLGGRHTFLITTQRLYPTLWRRLNTFWRESPSEAVPRWATDRGVVDEWMFRAARETIDRWSRDPTGPAAMLEPTHIWFRYSEEAEPPDFAPTFHKPYPTYTSPKPLTNSILDMKREELRALLPEIRIEPLKDFENRMRAEFNQKLRAYSNFIESIWYYGSNPQMPVHAVWTVYAFAGMPVAQIARDYDPKTNSVLAFPLTLKQPDESVLESRHKVKDADAAVRKGVKRFCEATWITLPRKGLRRP